ncbi:MAG: hypothetical protein H8E31_05325, partial [Planctomycetes bacterium]|nr:hypothetical protein [Planctomycetota bacterium]
MKSTVTRLALVGAALLLSSSATAQLFKVGEIVLAPNESARGVSFEYPFAYVSVYGSGVQYKVDLTTPTAPILLSSYNPAFGDQHGENVAAFDRVVTGHRLGGLNLWNVLGAPFQLDSVSTNDHFDGLAFHPVGGQELLLYSEHNSGGNPGGLPAYDILGNTL